MGNNKNKKTGRWKKVFGILFLVVLLGVGAYSYYQKSQVNKISVTEFQNVIESKKVKNIKEITLLDNVGILTYDIKDEKYQVAIPKNYIKENSKLIDIFKKEHIKFKVENAKNWVDSVSNFVRILFTIIVIFFVYKIAEDYFKKIEIEEVKGEKLSFKDVAGASYVKTELQDIINYFKEPEKYKDYQEDLPRGILFEGPPGNGKTYIARALANECNVPFFQKSAADLEGKYVGVGSENIGRFFDVVRKRAKEAGGAVMFLDELDSIATKREIRTVVETNQTINKFLTEMDGFERDDNIIVIAATNLVSSLDEAVLRPGRFDRIIHIGKPKSEERIEVLNLYLDKKKDRIEKEVYEQNFVDTLAKITEGFSNAKLANLIKESSVLARRKGKNTIGIQDLREGFTKSIAGVKRTANLTEEDRKIVAYHEAGHAVAQLLTSPLGIKGVAYITITPYGQSLGHVSPVSPNTVLERKSQIQNQIIVALAGRAVEDKILNGDYTVGAVSDLNQANEMLTSYIADFGMSDMLENLFIKDKDENSEIMQNNKKIIRDELYKKTTDLVEKHFDMVEKIAEQLLESESIEQYELEDILKDTSYQFA